MSDNLTLWNKVKSPDPKFTKTFNRAGGFKGTATNTQYLVQVATKIFGPNGIGWGTTITSEQYIEGHTVNEHGDKSIIHVIRGKIWYVLDGEKHETSEQFGQTTFVGSNKYGAFTDEEAPKKSVTDMMLKCFSLLGFSADIFLGLYDDNKYVNDVSKSFNNPKTEIKPLPALPKDTGNPERNYQALLDALVLIDTNEQMDSFVKVNKEKFSKLMDNETMEFFKAEVGKRRKQIK